MCFLLDLKKLKSSKLAVKSLWNKQAQDEKEFQEAKEKRLHLEKLKEQERLKEEELEKRKEGKDIRAMFSSKPKKASKKKAPSITTKAKKLTEKQHSLDDMETPATEITTNDKIKLDLKPEALDEPIEQSNIDVTMNTEQSISEDNSKLTKRRKRKRNKIGLDFLKIKFVDNNNEKAAEEQKMLPPKVPSKDIRNMFARVKQEKQESENMIRVKSPLTITKMECSEKEFKSQEFNYSVDMILNASNSDIEIKLEDCMQVSDDKEKATKSCDLSSASVIGSQTDANTNDCSVSEVQSPGKDITNNVFTSLKSGSRSDVKNHNNTVIKELSCQKSKRKRSNSEKGDNDSTSSKKLKQSTEENVDTPPRRSSLRSRQSSSFFKTTLQIQETEEKVVVESSDSTDIENADEIASEIASQKPTTEQNGKNEKGKEDHNNVDGDAASPITTLRRSRRSKQKVNYNEDDNSKKVTSAKAEVSPTKNATKKQKGAKKDAKSEETKDYSASILDKSVVEIENPSTTKNSKQDKMLKPLIFPEPKKSVKPVIGKVTYYSEFSCCFELFVYCSESFSCFFSNILFRD